MPDEKQIRNTILLRLLGSPLVIAPFLAGMTVLTSVWAMGIKPGIGWFAGLAGLLASGGVLLTRLVFGGDALARRVTEDLTRREQQGQQQSLDELDRHLTEADNDPRPEASLRDLRALVGAFIDAEAEANPAHLPLLVEIRASVNQLFEQCVQSIRQTDKLWQTARQLNTPAARQPLLNQREKILADVQATVKQLSDALVGLQTLGVKEGSSTELTRLREELDRSLTLAQTVEARVQSLLEDTPLRDTPPTPN